jgi:hypothetical protein
VSPGRSGGERPDPQIVSPKTAGLKSGAYTNEDRPPARCAEQRQDAEGDASGGQLSAASTLGRSDPRRLAKNDPKLIFWELASGGAASRLLM